MYEWCLMLMQKRMLAPTLNSILLCIDALQVFHFIVCSKVLQFFRLNLFCIWLLLQMPSVLWFSDNCIAIGNQWKKLHNLHNKRCNASAYWRVETLVGIINRFYTSEFSSLFYRKMQKKRGKIAFWIENKWFYMWKASVFAYRYKFRGILPIWIVEI